MPSIFSHLPFILSHPDFSPCNIMVDAVSGRLNGIIDWARSSHLPLWRELVHAAAFLGYPASGTGLEPIPRSRSSASHVLGGFSEGSRGLVGRGGRSYQVCTDPGLSPDSWFHQKAAE